MNSLNLYQSDKYLYRASTNLCRDVKNLYGESINLLKWKPAVRVQTNACTSERKSMHKQIYNTKTSHPPPLEGLGEAGKEGRLATP